MVATAAQMSHEAYHRQPEDAAPLSVQLAQLGQETEHVKTGHAKIDQAHFRRTQQAPL